MSGKQDAMVVHALFSSVVPTHRASSHTAAEGASARAQLLLRRTARRQPVLLLVPCHPAHESYSSVPYLFGNEVKKFFVDRSHLGSLPMTHMIMDEGEDSKGKSVKTDLSLVLNMFSFQSHFVCAKKKKKNVNDASESARRGETIWGALLVQELDTTFQKKSYTYSIE